MAANPNPKFVSAIYHASGWCLSRFDGIAPKLNLSPGVLDVPALIALLAYAVASWLTTELIRIFLPPNLEQVSPSQA